MFTSSRLDMAGVGIGVMEPMLFATIGTSIIFSKLPGDTILKLCWWCAQVNGKTPRGMHHS